MAKVILRNAHVRFPIYSGAQRSLRSMFSSLRVGGQFDEANGLVVVHALRDLSLSLGDGDRLGVIGHNGAGKTTLLRLISGVYEPSEGEVEREGTVSALTDLTMGMDMEATGYNNIIMRGVFLGLSRKESRALIPEIEAFTELGDFLAMPVRTYSTGMMLRLAFAVSTAVQADILVMDELIGAGDAAFMEKASARVDRYIGEARILVLAAHGLDTVRKFCNRAIAIQQGRIIASGGVDEVIAAYHESVAA